MKNKLNVTVGIIAFTVILPLQMVLESQPFRLLSFLLWLSSVTLLLFIILKGIYYVSEYGEEDIHPKWLSVSFFLTKILSGFLLIISVLLFLVNLVISWFDNSIVSYKLIPPFALLGVLGNYFLNDRAVADWLRAVMEKWTPLIGSWSARTKAYYEQQMLPWVLKRKIWLGVLALLILLVVIIPMSFKSFPTSPKLLTLQLTGMDSIARDFDQHVPIAIVNNSDSTRNVYLDVSQRGGDSLTFGFIGEGSTFEKIRLKEVYGRSEGFIDLFIHAATAQLKDYSFDVRLFEADSSNLSDARVVDEQTINIRIIQRPAKVSFTLLAEEPFSLRKTFLIKNESPNFVSDFSLSLDPSLSNKATLTPSIKHYPLRGGEELTVSVEPRLHVGFSGVEGRVLGQSPGLQQTLEIPVSFTPPDHKRLYLAVAHCGSESSTRVRECINRHRAKVPVDNPPGYSGPDPTNTTASPHHIDPPVPAAPVHDHTTPLPTTTTDQDPEGEDEGYANPFGSANYDEARATREQVLQNANNLKIKLEKMLEKYGSGVQGKINKAIQQLNEAIALVEPAGELTPADIRKVNELMKVPNALFNELIDEDAMNNRRADLTRTLPDIPGNTPFNLRINGVTASKDNSGAPAMYVSKDAFHFSWHKLSHFGSQNQRVFYSKHNRKGEVMLSPVEMNPEEEYGRWPFVLEGDHGEVFYAWQGNRPPGTPEIFFRNSLDSGRTWQNRVQITRHGYGTFSPRMAYSKGTVYLYWTDYSTPNPQVLVSYSKDKGNTFSAPYPVTSAVKYDGTTKLVVNDQSLQFLFESIRNGQNVIMYKRIFLDELERPGSNLPVPERVLGPGSQPALTLDEQNRLHVAIVNGAGAQSEIHYVLLDETTPGGVVKIPVTRDSAYSFSPSIFVTGGKTYILYHSNAAHPEQSQDHLYLVSAPYGSDTWPEAYRLPGLAGNTKHIYLAVNFMLPWNRRIYNTHNVKVLLNGWSVGHLKDKMPEGKILFTVNPGILQYDNTQPNIVTLETEHFNPAHYLATSDVTLVADMSFVEQFVYANSQREADQLLSARAEFNHSKPDMGVYANADTNIPLAPQDGEELRVRLKIWNLGQGTATASRVDIFGGSQHMTDNEYVDRNLLAQTRLTSVAPQSHTDLDIPITYWSGLEKIVVRVVTKEEDFNLQNNSYTITFKGKDTPNAYNTTFSENSNGVLRVAVYDEPGLIARDIKIQLFPSGSNQPVVTTEQNPRISILPFNEYDINVKSIEGIEHWIRGVPVAPSPGSTGYQGAVSLDIMLQRIEGTIKSLNGERSGSEIIFSMPSEILFHTNEYEINLYAEDYLKRVKAVLNAYPKSTLIIEGHTDALGNDHDNLILSERRANEVKKWLIDKENIEAGRLNTIGLGASVPIADNATAEGRMKNRRVKFKLQLH